MLDYCEGTQHSHWLFRGPSQLAQLRSYVTDSAKQRLMNGIETPRPQSFAIQTARFGSLPSIKVDNNDTTTNKRPRPDGPALEAVDAVTYQEEKILLEYYAYMIQDSCGQQSESIRRGAHVQATAIAYLKRFFLSNSMLDFDPKIVLMACMFLAGKVEYEYIKLSELKQVFGDKYGRQIIDFEASLLQGLSFNLKTFHPYNSYMGLIAGLENLNKVKKIGLSAEDLRRLQATGQELIDKTMTTDLPLLYTPGRLALATLLATGDKLALRSNIDEYLRYYFEEEEEYAEILAEAHDLMPVHERELTGGLLSLQERKDRRVDLWKEAVSKLKKCARWAGKSDKRSKKQRLIPAADANGTQKAPT